MFIIMMMCDEVISQLNDVDEDCEDDTDDKVETAEKNEISQMSNSEVNYDETGVSLNPNLKFLHRCPRMLQLSVTFATLYLHPRFWKSSFCVKQFIIR